MVKESARLALHFGLPIQELHIHHDNGTKKFIEALKKYGKQWKKVEEYIAT